MRIELENGAGWVEVSLEASLPLCAEDKAFVEGITSLLGEYLNHRAALEEAKRDA